MRQNTFIFTFLVFLVPPLGVAQVNGQGLEGEKERVSYSVGFQMGETLVYGKDQIDLDSFLRGLEHRLNDIDPLLPNDEMDAITGEFETTLASNERNMKNEAELKFLQANAQQKGIFQLASGLQYKVLTSGNGKSPVATDTVRAHYEGRLLTGEVFDSSYERGTPVTLPVNRVIPGWSEALQLMKEGDKWELYVPNALAYGEQGAPPGIPPFATLIFEIELIKIYTEEERMEIESHGHAH